MKFRKILLISLTAMAVTLCAPRLNVKLPSEKIKPALTPAKTFSSKKPKTDTIDLEKRERVQFRINLPEFKDRMYIGGKKVDSAIISPGAYRRRSPVDSFAQNIITIRPSFTPTASERGQFSGANPDKTNHPDRPNNPLGRCRIVLDYTYRMHGTSLTSSIADYDPDGNAQGLFRSNGCIRHDNEAIERMVAKLLINSRVSYITNYLRPHLESILDSAKKGLIRPEQIIRKTRPGYQIHIELADTFDIIVNYRLWDKNIQYTDSSIKMVVYRDIYDYMQGRRPPKRPRFNKDLEGNAFTKEQFIRDLYNCGIYKDTPSYLVDDTYDAIYDTLKIIMQQNKKVGQEIEIKHHGELKSTFSSYTSPYHLNK